MNSHTDFQDYRAFKPSRLKRITNIIYLILLGMLMGIVLIKLTGPSQKKVESGGNASSIANSQKLAPAPLSSVASYEQAVIAATQKAMSAVVSVHISGTQLVVRRFRDPFFDMLYGGRIGRKSISDMGSGVIIDPKGIIITNDHVIYAGETAKVQITVVLTDGRTFPAKIIKQFHTQDIAILSIEGSNLPYIEIGSSSEVTPGQTVLAIGNPFGDALTGGLIGGEPTVTRGIISATRRNLTITQYGITRYYRNMLQTDASINEGNSGGALIDLEGKLVGINTAIISPKSTGSIGIGFAAPSDRVKLILDSVNKYGDIGQPYAGISVQDVTRSIARSLDFDGSGGAIIDEIHRNSPGEKGGFKRGDIITKVNGFTVTSTEEVRSMFMGSVPGEQFALTVYRDGKIIDLKLVLGSE